MLKIHYICAKPSSYWISVATVFVSYYPCHYFNCSLANFILWFLLSPNESIFDLFMLNRISNDFFYNTPWFVRKTCTKVSQTLDTSSKSSIFFVELSQFPCQVLRRLKFSGLGFFMKSGQIWNLKNIDIYQT